MLRIAIVEDDKSYAKRLVKYVDRYEAEKNERFVVKCFLDGADIAEDYKAEYDIILMDVEMKCMDGMSAAREIRRQDPYVAIIFITNMPQYAMKGYEVEALDYVLKPINYFAFSTRMNRAIEKQRGRNRAWYTFHSKSGMRRICLSELRYVEVCDHELIYYVNDEMIPARGTLRDVEEQLVGTAERYGCNDVFFRCNKGCIVNLEHVIGLEEKDILLHGVRIPVSRSKRKKLLDIMNAFFVL